VKARLSLLNSLISAGFLAALTNREYSPALARYCSAVNTLDPFAADPFAARASFPKRSQQLNNGS
jgi:hypothetical protein